MKKALASLLIISTVIVSALCGCSRIPDEPQTTAAETYNYINDLGQTVYSQEEVKKKNIEQQYVKSINNIELVFNNYYVYGKNAATISVDEISYNGYSVGVHGKMNVKMIAIGSRSENMRIGYTAYDAENKIVRNSYLLVRLKGVKKGDTVEKCYFDFPPEAVKIVFHDYVK